MMQTSFLVAFLAGASGNALHDAIQADDIAMLTKHIDGGLEINEKGQGGQTPLMMAVLSGKTSAVEVLLSRGADTSIGEQDGYTPCHGAGFQGRAEIMKLLLKHGLRCDTDRHSDGYTALHRACWGREERHTSTVRVLLKAGTPPDQASSDGKMPVDLTSSVTTKKVLQHHLQKRQADAAREL